MPAHCDRALVTFDPGARVRRSDVEALAPRAVVCGVDQLDGLPAGTEAYVSVGDQEARDHAQRLPAAVAGHTLVVNEPEALLLTGAADAEQAAFALAGQVATAVVTVGPRGAIARRGRRAAPRAAASTSARAVDTTGAGDLFMAAYVWAGLRGMDDRRATALGRAVRLAFCHRPDCDRRRDHGSTADRGGSPARAAHRRPIPIPGKGALSKCQFVRRPALAACAAARGTARRLRRVTGWQRRGHRRQGGAGARELEEDRRRKGRRRHADGLGPGGARRPAQADRAAQRGVPGALPERDDQARREGHRGPQHDAQARRLGRQGARRRAGQPGPRGDGTDRQGRPAAPARRLRGGLRLGRPLRRRCCSTSTASPTTGRSSAPAGSTGSRRWARSWASSTTASRCPSRRRRSRSSSPSSREAKADGDVPIAFGNLDRWPGIHEFETVQAQFAEPDAVRDFVFGREGATFASPENEQAAATIQGWAEKGYFTPDFNGTGYDPAWEQFTRGKGRFLIAGTWLVPDLADAMGDKVGFMLMPPREAGGAAGFARRRGDPVRDHVEVGEPGRGRRLHRLHHQRRGRPRAGGDRQPAGDGDRRASRRARSRARCRRHGSRSPSRRA